MYLVIDHFVYGGCCFDCGCPAPLVAEIRPRTVVSQQILEPVRVWCEIVIASGGEQFEREQFFILCSCTGDDRVAFPNKTLYPCQVLSDGL